MSKLALFFDTETTGIPDFRAPASASAQPHVTQLAYILADEEGNELASACTMILPEGWECTEEITKITGLTTEGCTAGGVPLRSALQHFHLLMSKADVLVAHNVEFDILMLIISSHRIDAEAGFWLQDGLMRKDKFCTSEACTPVMKLVSSERGLRAGYPYRAPKLGVAYKHFTGQEFVGAHSAMADTRACKAVYEGLQRWGHV